MRLCLQLGRVHLWKGGRVVEIRHARLSGCFALLSWLLLFFNYNILRLLGLALLLLDQLLLVQLLGFFLESLFLQFLQSLTFFLAQKQVVIVIIDNFLFRFFLASLFRLDLFCARLGWFLLLDLFCMLYGLRSDSVVTVGRLFQVWGGRLAILL